MFQPCLELDGVLMERLLRFELVWSGVDREFFSLSFSMRTSMSRMFHVLVLDMTRYAPKHEIFGENETLSII